MTASTVVFLIDGSDVGDNRSVDNIELGLFCCGTVQMRLTLVQRVRILGYCHSKDFRVVRVRLADAVALCMGFLRGRFHFFQNTFVSILEQSSCVARLDVSLRTLGKPRRRQRQPRWKSTRTSWRPRESVQPHQLTLTPKYSALLPFHVAKLPSLRLVGFAVVGRTGRVWDVYLDSQLTGSRGLGIR